MDARYDLNATQAFVKSLEAILGPEADEVEVRGYKTRELVGRTVNISMPRQRCLVLPGRRDDIVAKCAETLWMLDGRQDITWLSYYLPRAPQFADDGLNWRGAYGPRLRYWYGVDQIKYVYELLQRDPFSRQAIINLWDPTVDTQPGKDIPCNNWLQFIARPWMGETYLHLHVAQRSSDVWWGFSGIDLFSWSVLQDLMAGWLGFEVGSYKHFIGSFHLYERHYDTAKRLLERYDGLKIDNQLWDIYHLLGVPKVAGSGSFSTLSADLAIIWKAERAARNYVVDPELYLVELLNAWANLRTLTDSLLCTLGQVMVIGAMSKVNDWSLLIDLLDDMPLSDLWVALLEWLCRKDNGDHCAFLDLLSYLPPDVYHYVYNVCALGEELAP